MEDDGKRFYGQGIALEEKGDVAGAFDAFRLSAKANPAVAAPYVGLARLMARNQQRGDAIACLERAVACEPENARVKAILGRVLVDDGQLKDAKLVFESALDHEPDLPSALHGLAALLEDMGQRSAAAEAYRKLLVLHPDHTEGLVGLLTVAEGIDRIAAADFARKQLESADDQDAALIAYALGKLQSRAGDFQGSLISWQQANVARRRSAGEFDRQKFDRRVDRLIDIFSESFFAARNGWGDTSSRAVFIVGLPRSGTTLTEQILAGHAKVFGAGELDLLTDLTTAVQDRLQNPQLSWPSAANEMTEDQFTSIAADYFSRLATIAPAGSTRVVDKQPLNFWHLGMIATAMPNAHVIHCRRDIRDCGLSIFAENFTPQQRWATDFDDIVYYWRGYRRLMKHWCDVSGLRVLEVDYEATVSDLTGQSKRMLNFLQLPWDENVLAFHKTERAVQTPSRWQVRKPLYQSSSGRWKAYKDGIAPLIEASSESS